MGIKVLSRWRVVALVAGLALLALTLPVQAEHVNPTFVGGNSDCSTVGSVGTSSFTLVAPITTGSYSPEPGVTISLTEVSRTSFKFSVDNADVYDVIVKGSGSNWYQYHDPVTSETVDVGTLVIPNGNKLNVIHFCYSPGIPFPDDCGVVEVSGVGEDANATFTRTSGDCNDGKRVIIGVENDVITFIPTGGDPNSTYDGTINFTKYSNESNTLILQYDPDGDGVAGFRVVPDCAGTVPTPPEGDSWCVTTASAVHNSTTAAGIASWTFTWNVKGFGDPLFK
jgi:hypothetical protein